jgi:HlyD family secretion protein
MAVGEENFSKIEVQKSVGIEDASFQKKENYRRSRPWLTPLLLGAGLGVAIALGGMRMIGNRPPSSASVAPVTASVAPAMTVTVTAAQNATIARSLTATGTIAARDLIPVLPQANGLQIKEIYVKEGQFVKQGQVLAKLDDSILQEQIRSSKADVESKQADVTSRKANLASKLAGVTSSEAGVTSNQAQVQQRQADLAQAKAKLAEAQTNYQRNQQLVAAGAISRQQLDTSATNVATAIEAVRLAEANIRSAQANVSSAQANIGSSQASVRIAQADITSAEADVRSSAAKVEQLKAQLGQTLVRAPLSGIIAEKLVRVGDVTGVAPQTQVGNVVGGSQKLFSIIRDGSLEMQARIPETQLQQVRLGASVEVTSDADRRVRLQGRVREIEPLVNDQRREATVKIDIPTTNLLKPGMFARAAITTTTTTAVAIPQKAVLPQSDGSAIVFMLSGEDRVRAQKVEVGDIMTGGRVEIKSGLKIGDRAIVDGAGYLKDGDKVRVVGQ